MGRFGGSREDERSWGQRESLPCLRDLDLWDPLKSGNHKFSNGVKSLSPDKPSGHRFAVQVDSRTAALPLCFRP